VSTVTVAHREPAHAAGDPARVDPPERAMSDEDFYPCAIPLPEQRSGVRASVGRSTKARIEAVYGVQAIGAGKADLYVLDDFLGPAECDALKALIDDACNPSALFNAAEFPGYRTSHSCNLSPYEPVVRLIDLALSGLLAIDPRHGEALQGQRYREGQEFKRHADFFFIDQSYWNDVKDRGGQRTWTAMMYLDTPEAGGATGFPHLGIQVQPRAGRLLAWNNMAADGSPNSWTIHEGCPVEKGVKHIVTKWYREAPWS
jgi:prolyl 4-hydroxylase